MALALDGVGHSQAGTVSLTTTGANDLILMFVNTVSSPQRTVSTIASTNTTGWVKRKQLTYNTTDSVEIWWGVATAKLTAEVITVTMSGSIGTELDLIACGVSGANNSSPWDPNVSVPATNTGTTASPSVSGISTSNPSDMLLATVGSSNGAGSPGAPAGFSVIFSANGAGGGIQSAHEEIVSSAQSSITVTYSGTSNPWGMIVDAVQSAKPFALPDVPDAAKKLPSQQSDVYRGSRSLLTPNPARPFAQYDWPKEPKLPSLPSDCYRGSFSLLSPNPARPFAQYDWPKEPRLPSLPSDSYRGSFSLLNPGTPFRQLDWYQIRPQQKAKIDDFVYPLALVPVPPFNQFDWPIPVRIPLSLRGDAVASPPMLIYPGFPFGPSDWPRPVGTQKAKIDDFVNVSITLPVAVIPSPFFQTDWVNPARPQSAVRQELLTNMLSLLFPFAPFNQFDWPRARDPQEPGQRHLILPVLNIPAPVAPIVGLIDYFFLFGSQMLANIDSVVGPYFATNLKNLDVLLIQDLRQSDIPNAGYRLCITKPTPIDNALFNHPNIELVVNRTAMLAKKPSLLLSKYADTSNISIMMNNSGATYTQRGLS